MALKVGSQDVDDVKVGSTTVDQVRVGSDLVWPTGPVPKVDSSHALVTGTTTMTRLTGGALEGMTASDATAVDGAYASTTPGTVAFAKETIPATSPTTVRITALIRADKTSGRKSSVGFSTVAAGSATATSTSAEIGHWAGQGIKFDAPHLGWTGVGATLIPEAAVVDGAWYRVTLTWDAAITKDAATAARVNGMVEMADGSALPVSVHPTNIVTLRASAATHKPLTLVAKTNSPNGTVKDLTYVDPMLGVADDDGPVYLNPYMGAGGDLNDRTVIYSKGKVAPARVIITAGGSGVWGGSADWGSTAGRNGAQYDGIRAMWRGLSDLGYTVVHPQALHEGWGADDHLTKQLESLDAIKAEFGTDVRLYYLAYSMGGVSAWRAIMGRAGYPSIRAAYIVAGIAQLDMYYDNPSFSQIQTRWPVRADLDEPMNYDAAELLARGTHVRLVTSTSDANVAKAAHHDLMKAKYGSSPLFSEVVHSGVLHFDAAYWDFADAAAFFESVDAT